MHLRAAEALLATHGDLPINLKFVFEGEEESSSVHLDAWLEAHREQVAADVAIISDTGFFEGNVPSITVGLRGADVRPDRRGPWRRSTSTPAASAGPSRTRPTRSP
jgi:acetylornithine deacetylase/succinyl-diaminopimelate desuccinylase-like protein